MNLTELLPLISLSLLALISLSFLWLTIKQKNQLERDVQEERQTQQAEVVRLTSEVSHLGEQNRKITAELAELEKLKESQQSRIHELTHELERKEQELELKLDKERSNTQLQLQQAEEKIQLLQDARETLNKEFQALANQILEQKATAWREDSKSSMEGILNPLREQLKDFKTKVEDVYDKESKERISLLHEITSLKQLNEQMSEDALNLTKALKGESKTQGNWGEVVLERVLESSGLTKGREYITQANLKNDEGQRFAPDVIVKLPDGKDIIIDAKVSLTEYERFCSAEEDGERERALKGHINSIKGHIKGLGDKSYESLEGVNSPDFVFIFIPIEPAYMLAAQAEPELFSDAIAQKIVLVSPSTLLASLRVIENIWRVERQSKNAEEIARQAANLYDKLVNYVESLEEVGSRIRQAEKAYTKAHGQLYSGNGSLIGRAEKLKRLGASPKKHLPEAMVDNALTHEDEESSDDSDKDA